MAGIVCAVGWALSLRGLSAAPGVGSSDDEIEEFYLDRSNGTAAFVRLQILVVSTIAYLWFVGVVRGRIGAREPRLFGTVFLGGSILLAGLLFVGGSLLAAPSLLVVLADEVPGADAVEVSRAAATAMLSVAAPRVATLVMFSTAGLGAATGALPRWLVRTTYLVGVVEFVNVTISTPTLYIVPGWIALVSAVLLVRPPPSGLELPAAAA